MEIALSASIRTTRKFRWRRRLSWWRRLLLRVALPTVAIVAASVWPESLVLLMAVGSFTDDLKNALIDHVFKTSAYTVPTNIKIALSTADPTDDGSGLAEPSGGSYARVTSNTWDAAASGATANTSDIDFATSTASWGVISHVAIFGDSTMIAYGPLSASNNITSGKQPKFLAGELTVALT